VPIGATEPPRSFVSTGALPAPERVQELVDQAHALFRSNGEGSTSTVYPALAQARTDHFGICVVGVTGSVYEAGDAGVGHAIMSVAKPFAFALLCEAVGPDEAVRRVGANATGLPFNEAEAIVRSPDGRTNPMVNPGAIATVSHAPGKTPEARRRSLHDGLSAFAGRPLEVDEEIHASAAATNHTNRALTALLEERHLLGCDGDTALATYTWLCSLTVTAHDLAVMGATLADGGVNPVSGARVVGADACRCTLAVMATAGLYETSGDWLVGVGLPGKSGIGGGIVTVSPGKGALGTFAPLLDGAGNSVKGQLAARFLARALGLDVFASAPAPSRRPPSR
jgi:glutaminase